MTKNKTKAAKNKTKIATNKTNKRQRIQNIATNETKSHEE
jgi:hypothetical protein